MFIELLANKKIVLIVAIILLSMSGLFIYERGRANGYNVLDKLEMQQNVDNQKIMVHIEGAVHRPGVYEVSANMRAYELVLLAGGIKPEADLSKTNMAKILSDGEKVFIPETKNRIKKEKAISVKKVNQSAPVIVLNVNYASVGELAAVCGVGEKLAKEIVVYRTQHGEFSKLDELNNVKGIGPKKLERLKKYLVI